MISFKVRVYNSNNYDLIMHYTNNDNIMYETSTVLLFIFSVSIFTKNERKSLVHVTICHE